MSTARGMIVTAIVIRIAQSLPNGLLPRHQASRARASSVNKLFALSVSACYWVIISSRSHPAGR